jgi:CO/xanthine dehydrogenase Mo-binding subunit
VGNAATMMKTNGPSHAVEYKSTKKQGWFLEGKQCVCADVISVCEIIKPTAPSPLTTAGVVRDVENKRPRIHRVVIAVDPGFAVNPLSIESQMQGGVTFGLTQVMPEGAIALKDGRVEQRNWNGYTPPYIKDAPAIVNALSAYGQTLS